MTKCVEFIDCHGFPILVCRMHGFETCHKCTVDFATKNDIHRLECTINSAKEDFQEAESPLLPPGTQVRWPMQKGKHLDGIIQGTAVEEELSVECYVVRFSHRNSLVPIDDVHNNWKILQRRLSH
jgi:hypothetical protein